MSGVSSLQVLEVVEAVGKLDGESLKRAQEWFESQKQQRKKFLMLRLVDPGHRAGQPGQLNQASVCCICRVITTHQQECHHQSGVSYLPVML